MKFLRRFSIPLTILAVIALTASVTYALTTIRTYPVQVEILPGLKNVSIATTTQPDVPIIGYNFSVYRGHDVSLDIVITNNGEEDLTNLTVNDLNLSSITIDYTPNVIPSLPVGANVTVNMLVTAVGDAPLGIVNTEQEWYEP